MANPKHLAVFQQGVEAWNKWRDNHPKLKPDLSRADFSKTNLAGGDAGNIDFTNTNLAGSHFSGTNISDVDFTEANLSSADLQDATLVNVNFTDAALAAANLRNATFKNAILLRVDLRIADLTGAKLREVYLAKADLTNTTLTGADLRDTVLGPANLREAILIDTKLMGANLSEAILYEANLTKANLTGANLMRANLSRAHLANANLENTDLRFGQLIACDFTQATLTGTKLYGTARDDWTIQGVFCRYIFGDANGEIRSPKDRDLAPGEFERLYRSLPTVEYLFQNGMTPIDPLIMDRVVQVIREQNPEYGIEFDSINASGVAPSIKFTVLLEQYKEAALAQVRDLYELKLQQVEAERDRYWAAITRALDAPREVKLIAAAPGSIVATDGSTINIDQHVEYITNLRDTVAALPEDSPTFTTVAKKAALDLIGGALKDVAKGQIKEAAKQIYELGKDLGPVIVNTAAYGFFKSCLGL